MSNTQSTKLCRGCAQILPLTAEFYRHKSDSWTGFSSQCKDCLNEKSRHYREANREKNREYQKQWYKDNTEAVKARAHAYHWKNREQVLEQKRQYRQANAEAVKEQQRRYREDNKEVLSARQSEWRRRNRARVREWERTNKALRRGAKGSVSWGTVWQMLEDQGHVCAYCEAPLFGNFHIEHMLPVSRGGTHDWTNIAITCGTCNRRKGAKTVEEFMNGA